jgi:hypothetical protein
VITQKELKKILRYDKNSNDAVEARRKALKSFEFYKGHGE